MADRINVSQLIAQTEYQLNQQRVSRLIAQIEYVGVPAGLHVSQLVAQIEYVEGTGGPTQEQLLRHGTWFGSGMKQRMWWAK